MRWNRWCALLTVDLETITPDPKGPDFRIDEVERVGWLADGSKIAYWAKCFCALPPDRHLLMHNAMYDFGIMWRSFGKYVLPEIEDTLALAYSIGEEDLSLKGLGQKYLGVQTVTHSQQDLIGAEQYHAQDLWLTQRLLPILKAKQQGISYDIDRALIPALVDCSYRGLVIDHDRLGKAISDAEGACSRTQAAFDRLVEETTVLKSRRKKTTKRDGTVYVEDHGPPDIGSAKQLQQFFGVHSADKNTLRDIARGEGNKALAAFLRLEWAGSNKLLSTYFLPAREKEKLTGLFNITPSEDMEGGTGTARLSSERANLQNQPPEMQRCLRAPEGMLLLGADFGQLELRAAAEISNDEYLITAFQEGRDLHEETREWLGLDSRTKAKNFNFGAGLYGGGPDFISQVVGRPKSQVDDLLRRHRNLWVGWWNWADRHWVEVQRTGLSVTPEPFCHVRPIPLLAGDHARKAAINHPVQAYASYITKAAMVRLFREGWLICNQVHDAIYAYIPADGNVDLLKQSFQGTMEDVAREYLPRVGAPVEVKVGTHWE